MEYFVYFSFWLANGKHGTENHATKVTKTKNAVTKICDELGIDFEGYQIK